MKCSLYTNLKLACAAAGVTGIRFASPNDANEVFASFTDVSDDIAFLQGAAYPSQVEAYVNFVVAEAEKKEAKDHSANSADTLASKAVTLFDKAGPSVFEGGAILGTVLALLKRVGNKVSKHMADPAKRSKTAKVGLSIAGIGIAIVLCKKIIKGLTAKYNEHKKNGLTKKSSALKEKLDRVEKQLALFETYKEKASAKA